MKRIPINKISKKKLREIRESRKLIYLDSCQLCHKTFDIRGVERIHIKHRGMGGRWGYMRDIYNDPRNIGYGCGRCHDIIDGRIKNDKREQMIEELKQLRGWYSWAEENGVIDYKDR